MGMAGLHFSR